jgi:hypothetical protein
MPRISDRKRVLQALEHEIEKKQVTIDYLRAIAGVDQNNESIDADVEDDDDKMLDIIECHDEVLETLQLTHNDIKNKRYLVDRKPYRSAINNTFQRDLQDNDNEDGSPPWLQEDEFLQKYRMHRESFHRLLPMIKDHPVFQSDGAKQQAPVAHQLLVLLFYLGKSGSGANNPTLQNMFQIGRGTPEEFK